MPAAASHFGSGSPLHESERPMPSKSSFVIGLVTPMVMIDLLFPVIDKVGIDVAGLPFFMVWIFAWFFLTSGCLGLCWVLFDRRHHPE
ncbi:DUF3311 domain-containing protein [Komagataeibacter melomenusus]